MISWFFARVLRRAVLHPPEVLRLSLLCVAVLSFGATGFLYFELRQSPQLTWTDAIWYSIVTITTVGYGDLSPVTLGGRYVVALPLMFFGIGLLGYVLSLAAGALVQAKQQEKQGLGKFSCKDHLVIFNFPSADKVLRVVEELKADSKFAAKAREIIVVDESLDLLPAELDALGLRYVRGAPARDDTLTRCNVDEAAYALVLSMRMNESFSDALNVTIALAIEARAPHVTTVVECVDASVEELLEKAGCDGISCTSRLDAHFLTQELLDPGAGDVIAQLTSNLSGQQVYITELAAVPASYGEAQRACQEKGHLSIGLRRNREVSLNPAASTPLARGDCIITIGPSRATF